MESLRDMWAELYDDKFPNNNIVEFNEETGEYSFITIEERRINERVIGSHRTETTRDKDD